MIYGLEWSVKILWSKLEHSSGPWQQDKSALQPQEAFLVGGFVSAGFMGKTVLSFPLGFLGSQPFLLLQRLTISDGTNHSEALKNIFLLLLVTLVEWWVLKETLLSLCRAVKTEILSILALCIILKIVLMSWRLLKGPKAMQKESSRDFLVHQEKNLNEKVVYPRIDPSEPLGLSNA